MQEGKVQNVAVVRTTNVMTPVTQVLVPGHVAAPGSVQMAKIAPATTTLPTQLTTVLPASNITSGVPVVQPAVTATKTILPQTTLQQVQGHNVVINRANMQQLQMSGEVGKLYTYILYLVQWNLSSGDTHKAEASVLWIEVSPEWSLGWSLLLRKQGNNL